MTVIEFNKRVEEMMAKEDNVTLCTFNLTERDLDIEELYWYTDVKKRIRIIDEETNKEEWGLRCLSRDELFNELTRIARGYKSERVAWIVLDRNLDYLYIKELNQKYYSEKGVFKDVIKKHMYEYGIDYLMIVQRISVDVYRWVFA